MEQVLQQKYSELELKLHPDCKKLLDEWQQLKEKYSGETFDFQVRDKVLKLPFTDKALGGSSIR